MNGKILSHMRGLVVFLFSIVVLGSCGGGGSSEHDGFPANAEALVGYRMEMQVKVFDQFAAHSFQSSPTHFDVSTAAQGVLSFDDGSSFTVSFRYRIDSEDLTVDESGNSILVHTVATLEIDLPAEMMADKNPNAVLYLVMQSLQADGAITLTNHSGLITNLPDTGRYPFESRSGRLYKPE